MSRKFNVYYDSYGLPPLLEAFEYLGRRFKFTSFQTQPITNTGGQSTICGELCLWVLMKLVKGEQFNNIINDII